MLFIGPSADIGYFDIIFLTTFVPKSHVYNNFKEINTQKPQTF